MKMKCFLATLAGLPLLSSCAFVAVHMAPSKRAVETRTPAAESADELFWSTLHGGQYDAIPAAMEAETAAYLASPDDAVSAAHIGWLHIWRLSERGRLNDVPATITDDAALSRKYFEESVTMDNHDARYLGFYASSTLIEGNIQHDERETRRGYFTLLRAITAWPEFNFFTAGYTLSTLPASSKRYKKALEWQWQNLDACAGERVDRTRAAYAKYMTLVTDKGAKRVCWNSWIAPHNFEGFFLNMGDMLVKSGAWQTARLIYANAKLSTSYAQWPYRQVLEDRIREAPGNVTAFNAPAKDQSDKHIMVTTRFSCMACHQK